MLVGSISFVQPGVIPFNLGQDKSFRADLHERFAAGPRLSRELARCAMLGPAALSLLPELTQASESPREPNDIVVDRETRIAEMP